MESKNYPTPEQRMMDEVFAEHAALYEGSGGTGAATTVAVLMVVAELRLVRKQREAQERSEAHVTHALSVSGYPRQTTEQRRCMHNVHIPCFCDAALPEQCPFLPTAKKAGG